MLLLNESGSQNSGFWVFSLAKRRSWRTAIGACLYGQEKSGRLYFLSEYN
jgi:hypothetical protein